MSPSAGTLAESEAKPSSLTGVSFTGSSFSGSSLTGVSFTGVSFTGADWLVDGGWRKTLGGTLPSGTRAAPAGVESELGVSVRFVAIGGGTVEMQAENSDVPPSRFWAVAVTNCPAGSAGTVAVKLPSPLSSVDTCVVPRYVSPSPLPDGSQTGVRNNSML